MRNSFGNFKPNLQNIDRYFVRKSIFDAISLSLPFLNGKLLDVGCGKMPYKEYILTNSKVESYIGLDIETARIYDELVKPDYTWDGIDMPLESNSFDSCLLTEVLEHCPDPNLVLSEINRVLKPGSSVFISVPFLWPLHEVPYDEYRYTPFSLERIIKNNGFVIQELKPLGGYNASLAVVLSLWINRHLKTSKRDVFLRYLIYPFIKLLIKRDRIPEDFSEGTMITGVYAIIKKV